MSQITLRILKGSALSQSEMDNNLRSLINSASVDITTGQLSLFTSESSGAEKAIDVRPQWFGLSGSSSTGVASITGSLLVTGDITAQQFNTEIISSSTIFESGSTIFGDDSNDTHQITGSLLVTGSETLEGNLTVSGSTTITGAIDSTGMSSKVRFHYNEFDDLPSATTYHGMFAHVHATGSAYYAHGGNWVRLAQSASFATPIATLTAASASHETAINTINAKTLVSSSDQIADEISGSFSATHLNSKIVGIVSGAVQIAPEISGSLGPNATFIRSLNASSISGSFGGLTAASVSGSLGVNATLIRSLTGAVISGSFTTTSASLAANIATNLTSINTLTSDKANKSEISGSLGDNATLIRSLTATSISGSFTAPSSSISTRLDSLEDASATAPAGTISGSVEGSAQGTIALNGVDVNVNAMQTGDSPTFATITATTLFTGSSLDVSGDITGSAALINGAITATGDITAFFSSDERLKDNITPIEGALDKINQIGGYGFDWNDNSEHSGHDVGVIAQEIEKVLPEVVVDRDTGYKAVRYDKIVALLIQAVKEQQLQIDELKSKL